MSPALSRPRGRAGYTASVRWRTCVRKTRYSSEYVAINAATVLRWRGLPPQRGYHCRFCDHWHLSRIDSPAAPVRGAERHHSMSQNPTRSGHDAAPEPRDAVSVWATAQRAPAAQRRGRYVPESTAHPAKMLPAIAAHAIAHYTQPGELVADPMCGIGTTLVEAVRLDRRAFGVEYEPRWADITRANLDRARTDGHTAQASVQRGDARQLATALSSEVAGQAALVVTSPPYGPSAHGHVTTVPGGGVHKRNHTYGSALDRGNLANIGQHRLLSGFTRVLAGCTRLLKPGGHVVITVRPWREHGELIDLPSQIEACGLRAGLVPVDRCVALLARVAETDLVARASFFQRDNIAKQRAAGLPLHLIAHEDVVVLQKPQAPSGSGILKPPATLRVAATRLGQA